MGEGWLDSIDKVLLHPNIVGLNTAVLVFASYGAFWLVVPAQLEDADLFCSNKTFAAEGNFSDSASAQSLSSNTEPLPGGNFNLNTSFAGSAKINASAVFNTSVVACMAGLNHVFGAVKVYQNWRLPNKDPHASHNHGNESGRIN